MRLREAQRKCGGKGLTRRAYRACVRKKTKTKGRKRRARARVSALGSIGQFLVQKAVSKAVSAMWEGVFR